MSYQLPDPFCSTIFLGRISICFFYSLCPGQALITSRLVSSLWSYLAASSSNSRFDLESDWSLSVTCHWICRCHLHHPEGWALKETEGIMCDIHLCCQHISLAHQLHRNLHSSIIHPFHICLLISYYVQIHSWWMRPWQWTKQILLSLHMLLLTLMHIFKLL